MEVLKTSTNFSTPQKELLPSQFALLHRMGFYDSIDPSLAQIAFDHISIIPGKPSASEAEDKFKSLLFIETLSIRFPKLSVTDTLNAVSIMSDVPILDAIITKYSLNQAVCCLDPSSPTGDRSLEFLAAASRKSFLALLGALAISRKSIGAIIPFLKFNFFEALEGSHSTIPSPREQLDPASTPSVVKSRLYPIRDFRYSLFILARRLGYEKPLYRLEGETGRQSNEPLYIVGCYCNTMKLGEGFGSSISLAETRAARDALERYYLEEEQNFSIFPSEVGLGDAKFVPLDLYDAYSAATSAPNHTRSTV